MRIAIINRFSESYIDYTKLFSENEEIVIFSSKEMEKTSNFKYYHYNGMDKNFYLDIIKEHQYKPFDKIVATIEYDIERAGELRSYLGIDGYSEDVALIFRDKYLMKKKVSNYMQVPKFKRISKWTEVFTYAQNEGFPFVIKPTLEAGSEGVHIIKNSNDLSRFFAKSKIENMLIEEFIEGSMYHVDGLYCGGKLLISVPSKYINGCLAFEKGNYLGSYILGSKHPDYDILNEKVKLILDEVESVHFTAFHAEFFKNDKGEFIFCEMGIRMGGGRIRETIQEYTGYDLLQEHIKGQVFDEGMSYVTTPNEDLLGWILIPYKKGKLIQTQIANFDWIINHYFDSSSIGKEYLEPDCSADCYISYVIRGKDEEDFIAKMNELGEWQKKNTVWEE